MANNTFPRPEDARGPLSVVREIVIESAANTLTNEDLTLPVNPQLGIGVLIRKVSFQPTIPTPVIPVADAVNDIETRFALSTRQGLTTMPAFQDPGVLGAGVSSTRAASQIGDTGVAFDSKVQGDDWEYRDFGLLVVTRTLTLYIESSGVIATGNVRVWVGFHLVRVEPEDLLAAISTISDIQ